MSWANVPQELHKLEGQPLSIILSKWHLGPVVEFEIIAQEWRNSLYNDRKNGIWDELAFRDELWTCMNILISLFYLFLGIPGGLLDQTLSISMALDALSNRL